jgi:hypothetical protein
MLYFIDLSSARKPETINGLARWGVTDEPLGGHMATQKIIVIDSAYLQSHTLPKNAIKVAQTQGYSIYRELY